MLKFVQNTEQNYTMQCVCCQGFSGTAVAAVLLSVIMRHSFRLSRTRGYASEKSIEEEPFDTVARMCYPWLAPAGAIVCERPRHVPRSEPHGAGLLGTGPRNPGPREPAPIIAPVSRYLWDPPGKRIRTLASQRLQLKVNHHWSALCLRRPSRISNHLSRRTSPENTQHHSGASISTSQRLSTYASSCCWES